ncbi:macrolide family glycosyltransferase [Kutzneria sp. CA-103260]|uniref:macrolide family glycosyltransferase n=1 Tax=Kutzneria sp. CA-103260 TaxID=2802641 RepID=UPI001BAC9F4D|nr:macrolide family glycosyltransferase [Kutzneria sp. CA-103260]QUQ63042.1 UDP-N-acetylglucosamine--N-acetylmuramyl-(pentapeptide) pyrophosphoryl-undecaprenol N-acetylglucosamine transferase [Kutzneria sp. CA-103260]
MANIAYLSLPLYGHVYPTLNFAEELVRRGHHVTYATSESHAEAVARTGARLLAYPEAMARNATFAGMDEVTTVKATLMGLRFVEQSLLLVDDLAAGLAEERPDLVVADALMFDVASVLARRWQVPAVVTHLHFAFDRNVDWRPQRLARAFPDLGDPELLDLAGRLGKAKAELGLGEDEAAATRELGLAFLPPSFQPDREKFGPHLQFVGPAVDGRSYAGDWQPPTDGKPVLLASLGSMVRQDGDFITLCIEAFGDLDWHIVLSLGGEDDGGREYPPNFEVRSWVPQRPVLSRAAVYLNNGGMGSIMTAVREGTPLLLAPELIDHQDVTAAAVDAGVARRIDLSQATAAELQQAVLDVAADEQMRAAVAVLRQEILDMRGAERAADIVEDRLRELAALSEVGSTALGVAMARAEESMRPDRLFDDELAADFVRASGIWQAQRYDEDNTVVRSAMGDYVALRTRLFDDFLLAAGCPQVVVVAAGLDSRAFRLPWADGVRVFEVDRADVLQVKESVLGRLGARPSCDRVVVTADLRGNWAQSLLDDGFDPTLPTAWLVEGLVVYLTEQDTDRMLAKITKLSAPGSRIAVEALTRHMLLTEPARQVLATGQDEALATLVSLWRNESTAEPTEWITTHGWRAHTRDLAEVAAEHDRPMPPTFDPRQPDTSRVVLLFGER